MVKRTEHAGGSASRGRRAVELAREFLLTLDGVTEERIELQLQPDSGEVTSLGGVLERLMESATTAAMKPAVVGKALGEGGISRLGKVLYGFDPHKVYKEYDTDSVRLLDDIISKLKLTHPIRREPRSIWPRFCVTILHSAKFLTQFTDWDDFDRWVRAFDDPRSRAALPMLLGEEIHGLGFALACDFLKELGYTGYCKPDTHIIKTFTALGLSSSDDDYDVFKAVVRVAENAGETPFTVDKLFWLIGSGNFYKSVGRIGRHREEFIEYALRRLDGT